jgi:ACT domain-containing protein
MRVNALFLTISNCKRKENNVNLTLRTLETHFEVYLKEQRRSDMEKRAVITVVGRDSVGIIAQISTELSKNLVNILDITQSVLQDLFVMIMLVDMSKCDLRFTDFVEAMVDKGEEMGVKIHVMHEDIFNSMHRI